MIDSRYATFAISPGGGRVLCCCTPIGYVGMGGEGGVERGGGVYQEYIYKNFIGQP